MVTWEGRVYEFKISGLGNDLISPMPYRFQLKPVPPVGQTAYYKITPEPGTAPGNPFDGMGFMLQTGRQLTKYTPKAHRLVSTQSDYVAKLTELANTIVGDKVEEDPCGYERLVGFIPVEGQPFNPVTFYKVEHTHKDPEASKVLLIVRATLVGTSPGGTIVVIS